MKTFSEALNEGKVSFDGMNFVVSTFNNSQGLALQFLPDSKTLDKFSKNAQVDAIMQRLKKNMPEFASVLWHESGNPAVGVILRIDTFALSDTITKAIK
jgi:hypothetical protein